MKNGFFIIGTDTGVGKTFVSCALASLLKETGIGVGVMKPVESGCPEGDGDDHDNILIPTDAMKLKLASGSEDHMDDINPYHFALPVAPNIAAREAHLHAKEIDMDRIKEVYDRLKKTNEMMIIEGGGRADDTCDKFKDDGGYGTFDRPAYNRRQRLKARHS